MRRYRSRSPRRAACAAALLALAGCTAAEYSPTSETTAHPPWRGEVRVLQRLPDPGTFERLGVVVVTGVEGSTEGAMLERLRETAAARGANAVVLQRPARNPAYSEGGGKRLAGWAVRLR